MKATQREDKSKRELKDNHRKAWAFSILFCLRGIGWTKDEHNRKSPAVHVKLEAEKKGDWSDGAPPNEETAPPDCVWGISFANKDDRFGDR
jgi:hypothetical protein